MLLAPSFLICGPLPYMLSIIEESALNGERIPFIEEIREKTIPILKRYGATRAGVFGSVVHGKARRRSDIDILAEIGDDLSLLDFVRIN